MDATLDCTVWCCPQEPAVWSRRGVAEKMAEFETLDSPWISTRQIAGQLDVPTRTLHQRRHDSFNLSHTGVVYKWVLVTS